MEASGLPSFCVLEEDLVVTEEEDNYQTNDHWPLLGKSPTSRQPTTPLAPGLPSTPRSDCVPKDASTSKRTMEDVLNSSGERHSPVSKALKQRKGDALPCSDHHYHHESDVPHSSDQHHQEGDSPLCSDHLHRHHYECDAPPYSVHHRQEDDAPPRSDHHHHQEGDAPHYSDNHHHQAGGDLQRTAHPTKPPPLQLHSALPAFAPRGEYVKLMFEDSLTVDIKLRWLAEVNRAYQLERTRAEVKMSAVTSRFVYVSRKRMDIVNSAEQGEFLAVKLVRQDSPERPRKLPTYLITRYPVGVDPSLSKEMDGVYTARRFYQDGKPINRIVVTWTPLDEPPPSFEFSFLPCLPPCEIRKLENDRPSCYKCWGVGHISRYCTAAEKCAYCSECHDSRTCPHRPPPPPPSSTGNDTSRPLQPPAEFTAHWRCPRCQEPGVSVWHGCARRKATPRQQFVSTPTQQPPSQASATATSLPPPPAVRSPQVQALRAAVEKLSARCASLEARFDSLETRMATRLASIEATLATQVEAQQVVVNSVTALTDRMDSFITRFEMCDRQSSSQSSSPKAARSSTGSRTLKKHSVR